MKTPSIQRFNMAALCLVFAAPMVGNAADPEPALSAKDLAARMSAAQQDGDSYVRLRMEVKNADGSAAETLQLQIKAHRTRTSTDVICQVLFPRERKGEGVLLRQGRSGSSGFLYRPPDNPRELAGAQWKQPLFNSDLSYEDLVEDFYAWDRQTLKGSETIDGVSCQVLESRPGSEGHGYASVRSWIDVRRTVPLRVEKYLESGGLACRIDTKKVVVTDDRRYVPADLEVRRTGRNTVTEMSGSKMRKDVQYGDNDFTPESLKDLAAQRSASGAKP